VTHSHHCHCWNTVPTTSLCLHPLFGLHKHSASVYECQRVHFFLHVGIQFHTFVSRTLPCQMPFCQAAPLLPSVTWQENVMKYWWGGSTSTVTPPISISDAVSQHNKIGGITFRAALVLGWPVKKNFLLAALLIYSNLTWKISFIGPFQPLFKLLWTKSILKGNIYKKKIYNVMSLHKKT